MSWLGAGFGAGVQRPESSRDMAVVLVEDMDLKQEAATDIQRRQRGGNRQVRGPD